MCHVVLEDEDRVYENKGSLYHRECLELIPTAYDVFTIKGEALESNIDPEFECAHEYF
ncbi:hypothetical protein [Enterococcus avium]|uniref:hypothetical protein n=1 Tax=Enterococcus avium TaxID=33945 RepID=UPI001A95A506|nr:hypothetical protein [Enterococcus avium]